MVASDEKFQMVETVRYKGTKKKLTHIFAILLKNFIGIVALFLC